jgi:DNA invertase Pin-like site-specific DNA recombinase
LKSISETLNDCNYLLDKYKDSPLAGNGKGVFRNHAGFQKKGRKATKEEAIQIKSLRRKGRTLRQIATQFNISEYQISKLTKSA